MKKSIVIFWTICSVILNPGITQTQSGTISEKEQVSIATPNATEFAKYGQIPVDLYNGLASVSIPLWQIPVRGFPVNIGLSYHGGGVKPNSKGSWVGVGWSLNATGTITRIQNGMIDENYNSAYGDPFLGYYWNKLTLDRTDWATSQALTLFLNRVVCQGAYGNSECQAMIPASQDRKLTDWAPDEFVFNFFGYSGSFWLSHTNQWVVRENSGDKFKVELLGEVGSYSYQYPIFPGAPIQSQAKQVPYMFKGFVLTDASGNRFIFGGDPNNIEMNRSFTGGTTLKSIPTSWYLRRIITNLNDIVDFEYERKYPTISLVNGVNSYEAKTIIPSNPDPPTNYYATTKLQTINGIVQDPVYLKKIKYNDYIVSIDYSEATLNKYPVLLGDSYDSYNEYTHYTSDWSFYQQEGGAPVSTKEFKIDKITITNGAYNKQFNFEYYDGAIANRTFLKKLREGSLQNSLTHDFEYYGTFFNTDISPFSNSLFIDGYLSTKTDHWGFYNGRMPFPISEVPVVNGYQQKNWSGYVTANFINQYYLNRNPDAAAMQIGALKKITYPTGGFTELIYEPHDYAKKISLTTYQAISAGGTQTAGGLRIKEIKSYAFASDQPLTKKYFYVKDGASSGILNSGGINYLDSREGTILISGSPQTFKYSFFYDNSQYPLLNKSGNHVTYSRVEEVLENGSKKIYEYSNHDDIKYIDAMSFDKVVTTANSLYYLPTNSRQFARGNLLRDQAFPVGSTTYIMQQETDYEDDQYSLNSRSGIRSYTLNQKDIVLMSFHKQGLLGQDAIFQQANIWAPNISSNMFYIHPYRPIEKRVAEVEQGGIINRRETYSYNTLNDKISQKDVLLLSNGQTRKTQYKYSIEKGTQPYLDMYQKNMINQLVEVKENKGFDQLSVSQTDYKNWSNGALFLPEIYKSAIFNNTPEVDVSIQAYGDKGTIQQTISKSGITTSYAWGYKNEYPTAKIVNAQNSFSQFYVLDPKNVSVDVPTNYSIFTDYSFKQYFTGDITCTLTFKSSPGSSSTLKAAITISDIASRSLCISTNNSCINGNTNTYTFSNVPPGDYIFSVSLIENVSSPQGRIDFNYNGGLLSSTGIKEFFYQGFEEETINIGTATPYAGKNYYIGNNGDYLVPFTIPNTRSYLVNYHYLQNGIWKNKTVNYSSNMILSDGDAIDEVRVYPSDAFISTYTYQPLLGLTSETDPNGKTLFYEYDNFLRLKIIRDQEGNIMKTFEYKYQEQQ